MHDALQHLTFQKRRHQLADLASSTRGFATWDVLIERFTPSEIRSMVRYGFLIRCHRVVYAVGHVPRDERSTWDAARASRGDGVAISHGAAASIHGFWTLRRRPPLHLSCARNMRPVPGATVHRTSTLRAIDVVEVDGSRITTVERTLVDLADLYPATLIARMMYEADHWSLIDTALLAEQVTRARGRRAHRVAGDAAAMRESGSAGSRSTFEERVDDRLAQAGIRTPAGCIRIRTARKSYEVDRAWMEERVVLEANGFPHWRPAARREDAARRRALTRTGYTVYEVEEDDLDRPDAWFRERFPVR